MQSENGKDGRPQGPNTKVTIIKPFYFGKYEVTQEQWQAVMGSNPSSYKGSNLPVEQVSWNAAQGFLTNPFRSGDFRVVAVAPEFSASIRARRKSRFFGEASCKSLTSAMSAGLGQSAICRRTADQPEARFGI